MQLAVSQIVESTETLMLLSYAPSEDSRLYYYLWANLVPGHCDDFKYNGP